VSVVIQKEMKVSRLSGTESVVGQRGKLEFYVLLNRKPTNMSVCLVGEHKCHYVTCCCILMKFTV